MKKRQTVLVTCLLGLLCLVIALHEVFFVTRFDKERLKQSLAAIQKKHGFPSITISDVKERARASNRKPSFTIPVDPQYELLVCKEQKWSKYRGTYHQWFLYPEPLYREEYIAKAASDRTALRPIDYCKHFLSQYIRNQERFDDDLVWAWPDEALRNSDGTFSIAIGRSAIAGSGISVTVDAEGNLVRYEHLHSGM